MHINIQSITLTTEAGLFNGKVAVIVKNNSILEKMMAKIRKIDGIDKVTRVYKN